MTTTKTKETPNWRRYRDACGTAQGLDLVGERWTLLVVRELLLGPKRFTELRKGLPGVSSNILTERFEMLERSGVVRRRTLTAPAASKVYELTDWGMELELVVVALGRWGARSPWRSEEDEIGMDGLVLSFRAMFDPNAGALQACYEIVLGEQAFMVEIGADGYRSPATHQPTPRRGSKRIPPHSARSSTKGATSMKRSGVKT